MSNNFFRINNGLNLTPQETAPTSPKKGDLYYDKPSDQLKVFNGSTWENVGSGGSSHDPVTINTTTPNGLSIDGNQVLSIDLADTDTTGALSSTDWNTFNNKQNALTLGNITSTSLSITGGTGAIIGSGVTINANINSLLPSQSGNSGKSLSTNGSSLNWQDPAISDVIGPSNLTPYTVNNSQITRLAISDSPVLSAKTATGIDRDWKSICWSPERRLFVATCLQPAQPSIMTSQDGVTWTSRTTPTGFIGYKVRWVSELGLFIAVGASSSGSTKIIISIDGITWSIGLNTSIVPTFYSVCWSSEKRLLVAVGSNSTIYTSSNGTTWTSASTALTNGATEIIWVKEIGQFVATTTNAIAKSFDGSTWTITTISASETPYRITWSSSLSVFIAAGTNCKWVSTDGGVTWSFDPDFNGYGTLSELLWVDEFKLFFAFFSFGGSIFMLYSETEYSFNSFISDVGVSKTSCWSPQLGKLVILTETMAGVSNYQTLNAAPFAGLSGGIYNGQVVELNGLIDNYSSLELKDIPGNIKTNKSYDEPAIIINKQKTVKLIWNIADYVWTRVK